jgi:hypothetical protein
MSFGARLWLVCAVVVASLQPMPALPDPLPLPVVFPLASNPTSQHELDKRPRRAEDRQTEIPPRQSANICTLVTDVLCDPDGDSPGFDKISLEAGENFTKCLEAAGQQAVWVSILGGTGTRLGACREAVTFKDVDLLETTCQDTRY